MEQDWFTQNAVKAGDPWFDQFAPKSELKPEDKSWFDKISNAIPESVKKYGKRILNTTGNDPQYEHLSPEEYHKQTGKMKVVGTPESEGTILPDWKSEPDTYLGGFARSLYRDFVRPMGSPNAVLGSAEVKPLPNYGPVSWQRGTPSTAPNVMASGTSKLNPSILNEQAVHDTAPITNALEKAKADFNNPAMQYGPKNAPLALPPAPQRTLYNGPAGTTESNKTYPLDIAPANPRLGQTTQINDTPKGPGELPVTVLPRETEGITNLDPITAANRGTSLGDIPELQTSSPEAMIGSLDALKNGQPMKSPTKEITLDNRGNKTVIPNAQSGIPVSKSGYSTDIGNIGDPNAPYQLPSAERQSKPRIKPTANAPLESSIESTESKSTAVAKNSSNGVPLPGSASVNTANVTTGKKSINKDISMFTQELASVDKTLANRQDTAPIAQAIVSAADQKAKWIATTERQLAEQVKGLGTGHQAERRLLGQYLDKGIPSANADQNLAQRAIAIKQILDQVHQDVGITMDQKLGYIENYLTHIKKMPGSDLSDGIGQVLDFHLGKTWRQVAGGAPLEGEASPNTIFSKYLGNPDSPFRLTRGKPKAELEMDVAKILPAYIESIAKLKFDQPAVDMAKKIINDMPDKDIYGNPSRIKGLAQWYVKNYTRYDSMPGLSEAWNDWTNKLARTTSRSMLGLSTGLQSLHVARIPANLWPELPTKYMAEGIKQVATKPLQAYSEAASLGLLQSEIRPFAFKTPMQKLDSFLGFFSAADFLDRSIGYHGFKKMFMDQGMNEVDASAAAIARSKSASLMVDSARPIKGTTQDSAIIGGLVGKLSTQFKTVPIKIIEQYATIAKNAKNDPAAASRALMGIGLAAAAGEEGYRTFHLSPKQFGLEMGGATWTVMQGIARDLIKGDVVAATKKTALWLTPAGMSIDRQIRNGPSMFESDQKKSTPKMRMRL